MPELSSSGLTLLEQYKLRKSALWAERESWLDHWQDIARHLMPRAGRFLVNDGKQNRGDKRYNNIYDSTGTKAHGILAAGLMSGATSPARPWFRLGLSDKDLEEFAPVKLWLHNVAGLMREIFNKSNTYRMLHGLYEELGAFGTASAFMLPDFKTVVYGYPTTIGEYAVACNPRGEVDTIYREFNMTVSQIVRDFVRQPDGSMRWDRASQQVKSAWDAHRLDMWVPVVHVVEPRADREARARDAKNMPWASCYYEQGRDENKMLRESGFRRFCALTPRWKVTSGDVYGESPGMVALGDIKQLQHQQFRKAQAIDYQVKPPITLPANAKNAGADLLPGGVSFIDSATQANKIGPLWESNLNLQNLLIDIQDVRQRIESAFFADVFMMVAQMDKSGVTAREIAEKHEEKLLMLGPVLERLHNELLGPLIDITFDRIIETGIVPPPPDELQDQELSIEFISVLAQAQRAVGMQSVDRLIGTVATIAGAKQDPAIWDKLDTDQIVDAYADMLGTDPQLIVADEKVALVRKQRAQQAAAMQQAATMQAGAETARTLSETDTGSENALTDLMNQFQGYSLPA